MDTYEDVLKDRAAGVAAAKLAGERYKAALCYFLTDHPRDAMLVLECGDTEDFGVNLLAVASGATPAEVLSDLAAEAAAIGLIFS